jgi:hypothetical protein
MPACMLLAAGLPPPKPHLRPMRRSLQPLLLPTSSSPASARSSVVRPLLPRQHAVREQIPAELIPTFVNGRWRKPKLSLRQQAEARKQAEAQGLYAAGADLLKGGWDPAWNRMPAMTVRPPSKVCLRCNLRLRGRRTDAACAGRQGTLGERRQPARVATITKAMQEMPKAIAAYRAEKKRLADIHPLERFLREKKFI